jgi:hypothetical protein
MKILAASLLVVLVLTGTASAQNATPDDRPTLYIGQDETTGDAIMSIGPARNNDTTSSDTDTLIISPEIILPPKNHHRHRLRDNNHPKKNGSRDFRNGPVDPQRPGIRQ